MPTLHTTDVEIMTNEIASEYSPPSKTTSFKMNFEDSVRDMHVALHIPYDYDYVTKLCRR
jgi:hypothetical protein